jgi:Outer membrane protein beta-barrel domain
MKKTLLAILLLFCFENARAQVAIGLKAGLNSASIIGQNEGPNHGGYPYPGGSPDTGGGIIMPGGPNMGSRLSNYDREYRLGFHAGVMANINIKAARGLALQPELLYSTKGYVVDHRTTNGNQTTKVEEISRMKYLDLPLMAQFQTGLFYLEAGPQASVLLNQETRGFRVTTETDASAGGPLTHTSTSSFTYKGREGYKFLDMGYGLGLGIKFPNNIFSCGLRYSHSLNTIFNDGKTNGRTSLLQLSLSGKLASFGG